MSQSHRGAEVPRGTTDFVKKDTFSAFEEVDLHGYAVLRRAVNGESEALGYLEPRNPESGHTCCVSCSLAELGARPVAKNGRPVESAERGLTALPTGPAATIKKARSTVRQMERDAAIGLGT
jgi:hypothetical protein